MAKDPLEALRRLCLAFPETTERLSHGEPTWFVRDKKTFVMYANHHHDDRLAFWCAAPDGAQETRVEPTSVEASRQAAAEARARVFVIFLDTLHTQIEGSANMRLPLTRFLDRVLGQDDLVAVMTPVE